MVAYNNPLALYLPDKQGVRATYIAGLALQRPRAYDEIIIGRELIYALHCGGERAHMVSIGISFFIAFQCGAIAVARAL